MPKTIVLRKKRNNISVKKVNRKLTQLSKYVHDTANMKFITDRYTFAYGATTSYNFPLSFIAATRTDAGTNSALPLESTRTGESVRIGKIHIGFAHYALPTVYAERVRFVLVRYRDTTGNTPTAANLFTTTSTASYVVSDFNHERVGKDKGIQIIWDHAVNLTQPDVLIPKLYSFKKTFTFKKPVNTTYSANNVTAIIGDTKCNHYFLWVFKDNVGANSYFNFFYNVMWDDSG